jgi:uncharacterized protein
MKLHVTSTGGENVFTGYGDGYVSVNHTRYTHPVVVAAGRSVQAWEPGSFEALREADFEALLALGCEIIILGTGERHRFPPPEVLRPLAAAGVGLEVMDTRAACRTYNILIAEGRQVVAAVLV